MYKPELDKHKLELEFMDRRIKRARVERQMTEWYRKGGLVELAQPANETEELLQTTRSIFLFGSDELKHAFSRAVRYFYRTGSQEYGGFRQWAESTVGRIPSTLPEGIDSFTYMEMDGRFQWARFVAEQLAICVDGREEEILKLLVPSENERGGFLLLDRMVNSMVESALREVASEAEFSRQGGQKPLYEGTLSPVERETLLVVLARGILAREYLGYDYPLLESYDPI